MMNKRGDTHIDWIISLGIFIVFILLLLVWIKPGYEPKYEEETLIDIVKNGIEKDFTWEVSKTLLRLDCNQLGTYAFNLDDYIHGVGSGKINVIAIKDSGEEKAVFTGALTIKLYSAGGKNKYWVVSSDALYEDNPNELGEVTPNLQCSVNVGEPIVKKGLTPNLLQGFRASENWRFPENRKLKIVFNDFKNGIKCYDKSGSVNCDIFQPESNVAVKSAEWRYNILDKNHDYSPVMINILVW